MISLILILYLTSCWFGNSKASPSFPENMDPLNESNDKYEERNYENKQDDVYYQQDDLASADEEMSYSDEAPRGVLYQDQRNQQPLVYHLSPSNQQQVQLPNQQQIQLPNQQQIQYPNQGFSQPPRFRIFPPGQYRPVYANLYWRKIVYPHPHVRVKPENFVPKSSNLIDHVYYETNETRFDDTSSENTNYVNNKNININKRKNKNGKKGMRRNFNYDLNNPTFNPVPDHRHYNPVPDHRHYNPVPDHHHYNHVPEVYHSYIAPSDFRRSRNSWIRQNWARNLLTSLMF